MSPGGSDSKEYICNVGDAGSIPGSGRFLGEGNGNPTPVFLPGKSHGQRSLVGYNPWDCKELDTTEQLTLSHKWSIIFKNYESLYRYDLPVIYHIPTNLQ